MRQIWNMVYHVLFRLSPRPCFGWRVFLLRCFGTKAGRQCHVYPSAVIWAPWNLEMGDAVAVANDAEIYNPSKITLGDRVVLSQGSYLCGASHDYTQWTFPLISKPIVVGQYAWIAARAIVLMGVTIGEGCVVGAGSVVTSSMAPWTVGAGNPCRIIKRNYEKH